MPLLDPRQTYAPFEYDKAHEYWLKQQQSHWLHTEVSMASDINDWKLNLTEGERQLVGHVLKGFTQSEVFIQDYWSQQVSNWFKKPEIQMMAAAFAGMESVHAVSYAYLNQSLGLEDFAAFLEEPTARAKIDRLINTRGRDPMSIATSLAVFSAFNEGVSLFCSFALLLNFSRFNKMKGVGQIIAFSIKDESLHSEAGRWLFRQFREEYGSQLNLAQLAADVYLAAETTVRLEDDFIEKAFDVGTVEGLTVNQMKSFIRRRADSMLEDLGYLKLWNLEPDPEMQWFDVLGAGVKHTDFFAQRVTDYAKGQIDWTNAFEGVE